MKKNRLPGVAPDRLAMLRAIDALARAAMSSTKVFISPAAGQELRMLMWVALAEEEGRIEHVGALARALKISQASTSRTVASFARSGALRTQPGEKDSRRTVVQLTKVGRAFVDEVLGAMQKAVLAEGERQRREIKN